MGLTLEETLDMVVSKADDMREKGILEFEGAGVHLRLAAKEQPAPLLVPIEPDQPIDPLDDPDTFGGEIPRRRGAPVKEQDDE